MPSDGLPFPFILISRSLIQLLARRRRIVVLTSGCLRSAPLFLGLALPTLDKKVISNAVFLGTMVPQISANSLSLSFRTLTAAFIMGTTKKSKLFKLLGAHLLDIGFPDLCRHPCWCVGRLFNLFPLSSEYVYFFRSPLPQSDILYAPISRF